jgi:hypothetical protein
VYVEQQPVEVLKQHAVPQPPLGEGMFTPQVRSRLYSPLDTPTPDTDTGPLQRHVVTHRALCAHSSRSSCRRRLWP